MSCQLPQAYLGNVIAARAYTNMVYHQVALLTYEILMVEGARLKIFTPRGYAS